MIYKIEQFMVYRQITKIIYFVYFFAFLKSLQFFGDSDLVKILVNAQTVVNLFYQFSLWIWPLQAVPTSWQPKRYLPKYCIQEHIVLQHACTKVVTTYIPWGNLQKIDIITASRSKQTFAISSTSQYSTGNMFKAISLTLYRMFYWKLYCFHAENMYAAVEIIEF